MNYEYLDHDHTYTLGMSLTIELIKYRLDAVVKIFLSTKINNSNSFNKFINSLNELGIDYEYNDKLINKLSVKENCYVIGVFNKYPQRLSGNRHYVLCNQNDEGEVGTIMRTLASFGFSDLILINCDVDIFSPKCIRSSMGGIFIVNTVKYDSIDDYCCDYPSQKLYYFNQKGNNKFHDSLIVGDYTLIFGTNELDAYYLDYQNDFDQLLISASVLNDLKII
ncbi:MAG: TrmH family RNA methyltransferase [Erysipelotrichaceae bacterium]|nr:TrmH family RNA methyltransferase [Erysipelotrichaceae bacterium]